MIQNNLNIILEDSILQAYQSLIQFKESPYFGVLVIGRPGTGKTYLCKYFAQIHNYSNLYFNCVNEFQSDREQQLIQEIENEQNKIVLFDEIEYFTFVEQEKYYNFLQIIKICQKQQHKVIFITQSPDRLDLLPSKLPYEKVIGLLLPESKFRQKFIQQNLSEFQFLIEQTDSYSISDLIALLKDIQMESLRKILNAQNFKLENGKYKIDNEGEQLTNDKKIQYLNDGLIEMDELTEIDIRRVLNNYRIK